LTADGSQMEPAAHLVAHGYRSSEGEARALRMADGRRIVEASHLITYNLRTSAYADHGVIRLEDGRYPRMSQCHAVHPAGRCYTAPWIPRPMTSPEDRPRWQCDLISFPDPLAGKAKK
jgi:hypothetical protein